MALTHPGVTPDISLDPIPHPTFVPAAPRGALLWNPASQHVQVRATGTPDVPVYAYQGSGGAHQLVVGPGAARAYVVDVTGHADDPWFVVSVLAYGFLDLAYRETIRYQRQHVWKVTQVT